MVTQLEAALDSVLDQVRADLAEREPAGRVEYLNALTVALHRLSPAAAQPVGAVRWIPVEKIHANGWNPNSVARNEMRLLHTSISHDGYTQPIVAVYDAEHDRFVIVDGFHRYTTMRLFDDIRASTGGLLPVVVIDKPVNDLMASTVRHNRARGKHAIAGMGRMVFTMLENGWTDAAICAEIGLEPDELLRLKHVTGFSKLFENVEYRRSWETKNQIQLRQEYEAREGAGSGQETEHHEGKGCEAGNNPAVLEEPAQ